MLSASSGKYNKSRGKSSVGCMDREETEVLDKQTEDAVHKILCLEDGGVRFLLYFYIFCQTSWRHISEYEYSECPP